MGKHVCPWWIGYLLISPLRRLFENPDAILEPLVREGMTVLDFGAGMGFFTLPAARLVGPKGLVIAVDVQERMLSTLVKRAKKQGLSDRIMTRLCASDDLGVTRPVDLCLAFHVVHEVPDASSLLVQIRDLLTPQGKLLLSEPKGHVSKEEFAETVGLAKAAGFTVVEEPSITRSHTVVMARGQI